MFGLDSSVLLTNEYLNSTGAHTNGNSNGNGMKFETELTPSSNGPSSNGPANRKEKWLVFNYPAKRVRTILSF